MASYFSDAQGTTVGSYANFQAVAGNSTITYNNYNKSQRDDRITVHGRTVRTIVDSDINFLRLLSSNILCVMVNSGAAATSSESQFIKLKKLVQTAEIFGCPGKFTATTLELVDRKDQAKFKEATAVCQRSALLAQIFAVTESDPLTLIAYDELADGDQFSSYYREKDMTVYHGLNYLFNAAIQCLRSEETQPFPVTKCWGDWFVNLRTSAWHYNPSSIALSPPEESCLEPFYNLLPPPRRDTPSLPQLNPGEIVTCVEEALGDFLFLVASCGKRKISDLSDFVRYGLLTFGAIVEEWSWKPILAHLPSTPSPEWFCKSLSPNVYAAYSDSVPWRVDLSFQTFGNLPVNIEFGLRVPQDSRLRLQAAYLCHEPLVDCDVVSIDQVGFRLRGTFFNDPTASTPATQVYLFVPPLRTELFNNMHCVRYPFPHNAFYWSCDPQGREVIDEKDWRGLGIPKLSMREWIGSFWDSDNHTCVKDYLSLRSYGLDGERYAREHGYPELIYGDPHDTIKIEELKSSDSKVEYSSLEPETSSSSFRLTPWGAASLLMKTHSKCNTELEDTPQLRKEDTAVTDWAKPGFLRKWYNLVSETVARGDDLDYSIVVC
ncbi:hypothetical protein PQX77_021763 [Marasmius sp. AFHP31]|nr:hypothetical protein PQX77_021763 [Marasmius sp. AFHP31]